MADHDRAKWFFEFEIRECISENRFSADVWLDVSRAQCGGVVECRQLRSGPVVVGRGCIGGIVTLADVAQSGNQSKTAEVIQQVSAPQR